MDKTRRLTGDSELSLGAAVDREKYWLGMKSYLRQRVQKMNNGVNKQIGRLIRE